MSDFRPSTLFIVPALGCARRITNLKGETMEKFLNAYIERMRLVFSRIPEKTAHVIASAFFAYKFELYPKTRRECTTALSQVPDGGGSDALKKALSIIQAYAEALENAQVKPDHVVSFNEAEHAYLAVNLPPDRIEDPDTLELDNALLLLYAVAVITSPDDEQALDEHRTYVITMLGTYKRALGIP
jgi:hypothetical protein